MMLDSFMCEQQMKEEGPHVAFSEDLGLLDQKMLVGDDVPFPEKSCWNTQEEMISTPTTASQTFCSTSEGPSSFCLAPKDVVTHPFLNTGLVSQGATRLSSPFQLSSSPNLSLPMGPMAMSRLGETSHNEFISTTRTHSPVNGLYPTLVPPVGNLEEHRAASVNEEIIRITHNGVDRSLMQLKENITRAPKEVLTAVLNALVDTNTDNSNYHIMELLTAANTFFHRSASPPLMSGPQFSTFESVHHASQPLSFVDPSCASPSEVVISNNKAPFLFGSRHSNASPTKRSGGGGGSRHHKNYNKEDDQRRCAIHGELRPMRCLKLLAETGEFECIPGYHCLVEKKNVDNSLANREQATVSVLMKEKKRFTAATLAEPIASTTAAARRHTTSIGSDFDSGVFVPASHHKAHGTSSSDPSGLSSNFLPYEHRSANDMTRSGSPSGAFTDSSQSSASKTSNSVLFVPQYLNDGVTEETKVTLPFPRNESARQSLQENSSVSVPSAPGVTEQTLLQTMFAFPARRY